MGWYTVDIPLILSKLVNGTISVFTFSSFGSTPVISLKFMILNNMFYWHSENSFHVRRCFECLVNKIFTTHNPLQFHSHKDCGHHTLPPQDPGLVPQHLHFNHHLSESWTGASLVAQMVKCPPTKRETWVWSLGRKDPLEKEMATHSSTLAWKIPQEEEPGRLQYMGSQRVGHNWITFCLNLSRSIYLVSKGNNRKDKSILTCNPVPRYREKRLENGAGSP